MENRAIKRRKAVLSWWEARRRKYNIGLLIAGVVAFVAYCVAGEALIDDFEATIFTTLFQGLLYILVMLVANVLYFLGPVADLLFNRNDSERFRVRLFNAGYWFSAAIPFIVPLWIVIGYFAGCYNNI